MSNDENNQDKKKRQVLPVVSLIAYTLGAVFLFLAPQNIFLSPEVALPAAGLTSPIFFSMLLLATTSAVLVATVFQKDRKLKATKKFTGKNIEGDVERINESVLLRKEQSKKEFNKFTYIISFLSMTFAIIQAWIIAKVMLKKLMMYVNLLNSFFDCSFRKSTDSFILSKSPSIFFPVNFFVAFSFLSF